MMKNGSAALRDTSMKIAVALAITLLALTAMHGGPASSAENSEASLADVPPPRPKPSPKGSIETQGVHLSAHLGTGGEIIGAGVTWSVSAYSGAGETFRSDDAEPEIELSPGRYVAHARFGASEAESEFLVNYDKVTRLRVPLDAGRIEASVVAGAATMPIDAAMLRLVALDRENREPLIETTGGRLEMIVPSGQYRLEATLGLVSTSSEFTVSAGATSSNELTLEVGYVVAEAIAAEGTEALAGASFGLSRVDDESGQEIARAGGRRAVFAIGPGEYRIAASFGLAEAEQLVRVNANAMTPVSMTLNAARLDLDAVGPVGERGLRTGDEARFRVFRDGIEGSIDPIAEIDSAAPTLRLAAGSYTIEAERDGELARESLKLVPGEQAMRRLVFAAGAIEVSATAGGQPLKAETVSLSAAPLSDDGSATGEAIDLGMLGAEPAALPEGRYRLVGLLEPGGAQAETPVTVATGGTELVALDFDVAEVRFEMRDKPDGNPLADGRWIVRPHGAGTPVTQTGAAIALRLPPGAYRIIAESGDRRAQGEITVKAGANDTVTLVPE